MSLPRRWAAVYARVSTEDQAEKGYSLESQVEECCKRAEELGYAKREIRIFSDDVSGASADRPELNRLREWCGSSGRPEVVIVYDPDRLARKLALQLMLTDEFLKRGITLEFVNFEWNNTPEGRMFYQLRGMFAEFEREKIRERTIRGRMTKLKNTGKLSGDPRLFGYRFDTVQDCLFVDPDTAATVQTIFKWAASGLSGEEIARRLAKEGFKAPRGTRWFGSTVTRILHNRSYLGEYKAYKTDYHQGYKRKRPESEQFTVPIEPLVNEELFEEAQRTLQRTRTRSGRPTKRDTLLNGAAQCSCGRAMVVGGGSSSRSYGYYVCSSKLKAAYPVGEGMNPAEPCSNGYWNTKVTDEAVWTKLTEWIITHSRRWVPYLLKSPMGLQTGGGGRLELASRKLEDLTAKLGRLVDLYMSEGISRELYDQKRMELEREQQRWMKEAAAIHDADKGLSDREETGCQESAGEPLMSWYSSEDGIRARLEALPAQQKRRILQLLAGKVELSVDRTIRLTSSMLLSEKPYDSQGHGGL